MHKLQFITSPLGEEMVVLPKAEYDAMAAALADANEDDEDVAIFDARMAELDRSKLLPPEVSSAILAGDSRLKAIRKHAGLTQVEVAQMAGKSQGYIADLEGGRRDITDAVAQGLAAVLDVPIEWIKG